MPLKCKETRRWRENFLSSKWLIINEDTVGKQISRQIFKQKKCKWKNQVEKNCAEFRGGGEAAL
jgi:hypothetical protein